MEKVIEEEGEFANKHVGDFLLKLWRNEIMELNNDDYLLKTMLEIV